MSVAQGRIRVEVASHDALDVRQFSVNEHISSLFFINVVAVSELPDIDFEGIAGLPASLTLTLDTGRTRTWKGVCSQVQQIRTEERGLSHYELLIVPSLWLAGQRRNHRIFQRMTEPEIALALLKEWGIEADVKLTGSYKKRKYRVQYGESDLAFLCRMLEDAGVSFYFDAEGDESKLVLSDAPQSNPPRDKALPFRDRATAADHEHVTAVRVGRRVRPGKYTVRDHDYRRAPTYPLLKTAAGAEGVEAKLEAFHYVPGGFLYESRPGESTPVADDHGKFRTDEGEGADLSKRRLDAKRATARLVSFDAHALDLAPGVVMQVSEHPRSELKGKLLVLAASISGAADTDWAHHCEACSADNPYRPPLSMPKPKVSGVESATVVGPPGEEIHTDEFGRVRVQFHWDREGKMDDKSSCWIHVSQPWGGAGFGGVNLPRVGQEVIVDFLSGDPDRPVVVGRVYTNLQKVPYKLPDNKTQSGWKSNSTQKTGGYNEIMFEDAAGQELVRIQAEKDLHRLVKHDEEDTVGHDRTRLVGHDEQLTVGNDRTKTVQHDETTTVGHDRTELVGNDEALTVAQNRTRQVGGNEDVAIGGNESEMIGVNRTIQVGANHTETIGSNMSVTVGSAMSLAVGSAKSEVVALASSEAVGALKAISVGGAFTITVGAGMATTVQGSHAESVTNVRAINAGSKFTVECGASKITVDKSGLIEIEGSDLKIKASGEVQIEASSGVKVNTSGTVKVKGSAVKLN